MTKEQHLQLLSADIAVKMPEGDFAKFDPATLLLIAQIVMIIVKECYLDNDKIKKPSWIDKIRLQWLIRGNTSWGEYRRYGKEVRDGLLKWGEETPTMIIQDYLGKLRDN